MYCKKNEGLNRKSFWNNLGSFWVAHKKRWFVFNYKIYGESSVGHL